MCEKEMNKYKAGMELHKEWLSADCHGTNALSFIEWLKRKAEPKDPLFEKFKEIYSLYEDVGLDFQAAFKRAKKVGLFTAGIDEAIRCIEDDVSTSSGKSWCLSILGAIKKRLEHVDHN